MPGEVGPHIYYFDFESSNAQMMYNWPMSNMSDAKYL